MVLYLQVKYKFMSLQEQIKEQLKDAMRSKDEVKLRTIRSIIAGFTNELLNLKRTPQDSLSDEEVLNVISKAVKQRKDSIESFTNGGREDLAKDEKAELEILLSYLPKQMTYEEVLDFVKNKIQELSLDKSKVGLLMSTLMKDLKGKADGSDVKKAVDELLN